MADLYAIFKPQKAYYDRKNFDSQEKYNQALKASSTVYVGNLSFYTTQDAIYQLFSLAGKVEEIIMGINQEGTPCGFCFVRFQNQNQAGIAVEYLSKSKLGDRVIRVDKDPGYLPGREKGRGTGGQQRREDFRNKEDAERPRKRAHHNNYEPRGERKYERNYKREKFEN